MQVKVNPSLAAQVNETAMLNCHHIDCQAVMCRTHCKPFLIVPAKWIVLIADQIPPVDAQN